MGAILQVYLPGPLKARLDNTSIDTTLSKKSICVLALYSFISYYKVKGSFAVTVLDFSKKSTKNSSKLRLDLSDELKMSLEGISGELG